jgi:hypothetical protein
MDTIIRVIPGEEGGIREVVSSVTDRSVLIALLLDVIRHLHFEETEQLEMMLHEAKEWQEANR